MTSLRDYLEFKDPERDSLEPNPEIDTDLYVDLDGLVPRCMARLAARAPKLVLFGDYGTGKTHLLHVIQAKLDRTRFSPVYVRLDAYGRFAESRHLHDALVTGLERAGLLVDSIPSASEGLDPDLALAFRLLQVNPHHAEAGAWLLARGPTPTQARKLGFSGRLADSTRGVGYVRIWRCLGNSYRENTGRELIFLLDESETFQEVVDRTRAADLGVAIRELFDPGNKDLGVVMGLTAPKSRQVDTHPLGRPDVVSRIGNLMERLGRLETPERRSRFVKDLLARMLVDPAAFLTGPALEELAHRGGKLARSLAGLQRDPVQREFVKLLDTLARGAQAQGVELPITPAHLPTGPA